MGDAYVSIAERSNRFRADVVAGIGDPGPHRLDYTFDLVGITDSGYKWNECISICAGSNACGSIRRFISLRHAPSNDERC